MKDLLIISSEELFKKNKVLHINHNGQTYILRITRDNKLILTK